MAVDALGGLAGVADGVDDEARAADGIAAGKDAGQVGHLILIRDDAAPFVGLDLTNSLSAGKDTGSKP